MGKGSRPLVDAATFAFFLHHTSEVDDDERTFRLTLEDIAQVNPNTHTCPIFQSQQNARIVRHCYQKAPVLIENNRKESNPWHIEIHSMFHMSNDSQSFQTSLALEKQGYHLQGGHYQKSGKRFYPLYEGKHFFIYDPQHNGKVHGHKERYPADAHLPLQPRYWVAEQSIIRKSNPSNRWFLAFRVITNNTNQRTLITSILPFAGLGNSINYITSSQPQQLYLLLAYFNSFIVDFIVREKLGNTNLNQWILKQFPAFSPSFYQQNTPWNREITLAEWIKTRVLELVYTTPELAPFASDLGYNGPPYPTDETRHFRLRCELDAAFFYLFEIGRDDVNNVMESFPIVKKNDLKRHQCYQTKQTILEIYDSMCAKSKRILAKK